MKIVDYYIVYSTQVLDITEPVKTMINQGWQPLGAPFLTDGSSDYMAQAMVTYEEEDDASD